jgi:TPP-dependent pyruvate/acetoin dehydrogenase alpha subunit
MTAEAKAAMRNKGTSQGAAAQEAPAAKKSFSLIPDEKLISLYAAMLKCRMLDERAQRLFKRNNYASAAGEEAAIAGVAGGLLPDDTIGPSPRAPFADFVKGAPLCQIVCQLKARAASGDSSPETCCGSPLEIGIAVGLALANKTQNNRKIAVSFCGNQSATKGWDDALRFAGVNKLPILFVSQGSPPANDAVQHLHGIPRIPVEVHDVVAVYRVASEAIAHARKGNGPTLIECVPYDLESRSAIGSGRRRNPEQQESRKDRDPLLNMEKYLAGKGLFRRNLKAGITAGFAKDLDAAIKAVRKRQVSGT